MEGMQAYGAGKAGGAFDPVTFLQQPQTILRIVSWVREMTNANSGFVVVVRLHDLRLSSSSCVGLSF